MANLIPLAIADFETQLGAAISAGDTSLELASATDDDGNALPAGMYCFTINNGSSNKQYLIGQLNGTDVTGVKWVSRQGVETSGAQYAARAGSPVIISDFATIQRVADILRGELALDGSNPIIYDAEPTLADRKELATVGYVLDAAFGGAITFDQQVISGTAGETFSAGSLVYFKTSDQEWYMTDADTAATVEGVQLGIALGAGSDGVAISGGIQISGTWTTTGLTAGATYYASNTGGAIAASAGTTPRIIGIALSTTKLLLIPRTPIDLKDAQQDALAGGGNFGTPSSTNKFATETLIGSRLSYTPTIATGTTTRDLSVAAGTQTIAHGLGTTPTYVSIKAVSPTASTSSGFSAGEWYTGGKVSSVSAYQAEGSSTSQDDYTLVSDSTMLACYASTDGRNQSATITVDATNITLTWTKSGSPNGVWSIVWLAKADSITYS